MSGVQALSPPFKYVAHGGVQGCTGLMEGCIRLLVDGLPLVGGRHKFFNTNNLWVNLDRLKETLSQSNGTLPLPLIKNKKTVNPRDSSSTPVFQLETAMGSAIECFDDAGAVVVPRERFAPVKTCGDLFILRSDAYKVLISASCCCTRPDTRLRQQCDTTMFALDTSLFLLMALLQAVCTDRLDQAHGWTTCMCLRCLSVCTNYDIQNCSHGK